MKGVKELSFKKNMLELTDLDNDGGLRGGGVGAGLRNRLSSVGNGNGRPRRAAPKLSNNSRVAAESEGERDAAGGGGGWQR